jgi:hypothetical protein
VGAGPVLAVTSAMLPVSSPFSTRSMRSFMYLERDTRSGGARASGWLVARTG